MALIIGNSTVGKASLSIDSFFCASLLGLGGLGGAASLEGLCEVVVAAVVVVPSSPSIPVSWTSSSLKSRGRAVVGDSGPLSLLFLF